MSLVPNNSLRYRSDYPGDTRCADCESCACQQEIRAKTIEVAINAADIDITGMSPTKVKYAIIQAIEGVSDD